MKRLALVVLLTILFTAAIFSVNGQVTVTTKTVVDDDLFITYNFQNLDPMIYSQTLTNSQFNASSIPLTIVNNLKKTNTTASYGLAPQPITHDDATHSIAASFFLSGSEIIGFSINRSTIKRVYEVNTLWRKVRVNLTDSFSLDFSQLLAQPVSQWQRNTYTDASGNKHPEYFINNQTAGLDVLFSLILPTSASNVQAQGDIVVYEMPPRLEDEVLSSPLLILAALIVILFIALLVRKIR